MHDLIYIRLSIALVWLYQGLWLKVLAREPRHEAIVRSVPFLSVRQARAALLGLGLVESLVGVLVVSGRFAVEVALLETVLLIGMNACGLLWGRRFIPDPAGMVVQNVAFLMLVWAAVGQATGLLAGLCFWRPEKRKPAGRPGACPTAPTSPWEKASFRGRTPQLLFGRMFEDPGIELDAFPARSRVFCIASAGSTARALAAAGHLVTAVDLNPVQLAYARTWANGGPVRDGAADRIIAQGRKLLPLLGWNERMRTAFLSMDSTAEQLDYWDRYLDTARWRTAMDVLLSRSVLRLAYARQFVAALKTRSFGPLLRARLRRGWAIHPNRSNPYAWRLLLGYADEAEPGPAVHPIHFVCADAAGFLESCKAGSFDAFSLSNIADGVSAEYLARLNCAVRRAAAPGAVVVARSFAGPVPDRAMNHAARDRSLLWGSVNVAHATWEGQYAASAETSSSAG